MAAYPELGVVMTSLVAALRNQVGRYDAVLLHHEAFPLTNAHVLDHPRRCGLLRSTVLLNIMMA
jgi:hypothetical protein